MKTEEGGFLLFYYIKDESSDLESQLNSNFYWIQLCKEWG